jgi:hypothetical protein
MAAQEVVQKHGRYYNAARFGRLFSAQTAVTGVAPGTAIGTTAAFSLHNPFGSGVYIAVRKVSMGYISGTFGAGTVFHCVNSNPQAAAPSGTAITEVPGIVNGNGPNGIALTTVTLAANPTPVRPFASLGASLASTAAAPWRIEEELEGEIILPPGCTYSLEAVAAAGTSPLVAFGVTWEEIGVDAD